MTDDEIKVRTVHLFLSCVRYVEDAAKRLAGATCAATPGSTALVERALMRELGILFRYWATRAIWERFEEQDALATRLNLALLRLFTNEFKLPKDGSGLRYAGLSGPVEEARELYHRLTNVLGEDRKPLMAEIQARFLHWREDVLAQSHEALDRPVEELESSVREWIERTSPGLPSG
ncbi:MAG TPA: hypothetical protein VGB20_06445 [bacterium]